MWRTGVGGSIVSMVAYVAATVGIFRLVRTAIASTLPRLAVFGAWIAAVAFALNPNLLYLETTAMTEPLYLALSVLALVSSRESVVNV